MPLRWQHYCMSFCFCWTPTSNDCKEPCFGWLLVLVDSFSLSKCGVCPKKVGEMALFGCNELHWTNFTWKLLLEWKTNWSKGVFWNAGAIGFQVVQLKKKMFCTKIIVHSWTFLNSVIAVGFSVKCLVWLIFDKSYAFVLSIW